MLKSKTKFSYPQWRVLKNYFFTRKAGLWRRSRQAEDHPEEPPLRAELLSVLQMEQHGRILANAHKLSDGKGRERDELLARLADNESVIIATCKQLTDTAKAGRQVTPGAEWLLDNFYLIEEQIRTAKRHLPENYSRELPRLLRSNSAGRPRVYDIALETIAHGDGRIDPEGLSKFVAAYQQISSLQLGELWAIPIMLRLALIENLRRVAARLAVSRTNRDLACAWADDMAEVTEKDPNNLILTVADMARSNPPMDGAFVAELARRLQGQSMTLMLPLTWISHRLAESGQSIESLIQLESQQQAADQVSISNSIGSLRLLSTMDWRDFVESMSLVESVLRKDPANVYASMNFSTRDQYRHVIEKIARFSPLSEAEVAIRVQRCASESKATHPLETRMSHVGYYLIGNGLGELQHAASYRLPLRQALPKIAASAPLTVYLCSILLLSLSATGIITWKAGASGAEPWLVALMVLAGLIAGSQLALSLVNWLATLITLPHPLPRMDFPDGIPLESSTIVVIPTMLFSTANIDSLTEALEVRFLANRDPHLRFCLLTDFADAITETMPADELLLLHAQKNIDQLNARYRAIDAGAALTSEPDSGPDDGTESGSGELKKNLSTQAIDYFILLHRPRRWNVREKIWMGYERKRGKLADLNAFLRRDTSSNISNATSNAISNAANISVNNSINNAFSLIAGDTTGLAQVRYVITLDTDTELPRDTARQFVATMAHPLNRARYDERQRRVCEGYGILQPRVAVSLPGADASYYELLCGGEIGIDPYTRTVSDVYQDVFGEGSFIGKGIYEVDIFERALQGCLPENRILSHDLLEGCYTRAGLLSDVQLYEPHPSTYSADVCRRRRWSRGDWQITTWLLPWVPAGVDPATGKTLRQGNPISALSRWKIFDNLRRSMVPVALTTLLLAAALALPAGWFWSGVVMALLLVPIACAFVVNLIRKSEDLLWRQHVASALRSTHQHMVHAALSITFLPFEAWFNLDAIVRTHWRIFVSHKNLLQWNPSSEANLQAGNSLRSYYRLMWIAPTLALVAALYLLAYRPVNFAPFAPFFLLWFLSPCIAYLISRPVRRHRVALNDDQKAFLSTLARKTWSFFDTYVGPADNWLPPDNVQEYPVAVVAHRTSPTNIGLSLLANLAAWDFGYVTGKKMLDRCASTFQSMAKMERYQGHFYNWYDTEQLKPLQPMYVSAVDSGNLAGHLLTLRPGLTAMADTPVIGPRLFHGIRDTYEVLINHAGAQLQKRLGAFATGLALACQAEPQSLLVVHDALTRLTRCANSFATSLEAATDPRVITWARALADQCHDALQEFQILVPWAQLPLATAWISDFPRLGEIPSLRQLTQLPVWLALELEKTPQFPLLQDDLTSLATLQNAVSQANFVATERLQLITQLAAQANAMAQMRYAFLYAPSTHLLAIGYNVTEQRLDNSYYDLLASEARLTTFIAIAQGQIPQESWFAMGRQLTIAGGQPILLSWSGSMFEYLMPLLVMPTFHTTLLDQTYHAAVQRHITYGQQRGVPWGISESGYNAFDASLNYQYRAFGVPGLGFKRGLGDDLVIAPYASMMALMVKPDMACKNLQAMSAAGFEGEYGFYEAVDFTSSRLARGQDNTVIRSFMTHHQGMGLLSLAYLLLDRPMQKRFESDPLFQATMSLLHERVPKASASYSNTTELADIRTTSGNPVMHLRVLKRPDSRTPEVQLLTNGRYHVMVTSAGGNYSRWNNLAVTRWREDSTRDHWGAFCYVRDLESGHFWSTTFQPTLVPPVNYEVIFTEGRAEFRRNDENINLHTEIVISPEDDIELRRTRIINRSGIRRTIDLTSYAEVVLAPDAADAIHPAFSNLFVQTEIISARQAILCTRRARSSEEKNPCMFHLMTVHGAQINEVSYETDRMHFIGRGNTPAAPQAMRQPGPLSNSQGSVLDPVVAIRYQITLEPKQSASFDIVTGIAESRNICLDLIDKYQDRHLAERVIELSWTHSQVMLRQLNASDAEAQLYGRLASSVIFVNPLLRAEANILRQNQRGQSSLWSFAVSGDIPIVLAQIKKQENLDLIRQLVQAHAYWRAKGLTVDLVIWNEEKNGYRHELQEQIMGLIASGTGAQSIDRPGGIFVRMADHIAAEDRILFQAVARVTLSDQRGSLAEQVNRRDLRDERRKNPQGKTTVLAAQRNRRVRSEERRTSLPLTYHSPALAGRPVRRDPPALHLHSVKPVRHAWPEEKEPPLHYQATAAGRETILSNGIGGFTPDGSEYVITLRAGQPTPAPWVNVIANARFGSVISECGQAYTWAENAHEFRLTPWSNDPVSDRGGEVFYLRDEASGHYWSPAPLPCRGEGDYVTRHGFGYSVFEHHESGTGITSELTIFIALDAAVKYSLLRVVNDSPETRHLSVSGYVEWVLGDLQQKTAMHIFTETDPATHAIVARNPYNTEFAHQTGFFDLDAPGSSVSGDRNEFIGRNRSLQNPAAMERMYLSNQLGAGLDPCAAIHAPFTLDPGEQCQFVFLLGVADTRSENISELIKRHRGLHAANDALKAVRAYWQKLLGTVRITTPDTSLNVLANGWLMYQTIACRLWARSGFYQSGGAFGFRDQLQDTMAMVHIEPALLREQLLLCAAHQFVEGDAQHWWHPPSGRGVRTRCSDDFLWLPLALIRYVTCTGERSILDESVGFIEGRQLNPEEDSYYDLPAVAGEVASLYIHGVRAIEKGLTFGAHGLCLIGSCDWNDGMDKVGHLGKGESVWLSFFLYQILTRFAPLALLHNDDVFANRCISEAEGLRKNIEASGWDGNWYRRAYFDDGTPLGSAQNSECQIDSISQSWSVLSGAGDAERSALAMQSFERRLVRRDDAIIQLLDPPFDHSDLNPGYIRGYVPGVRENGGQYTHAAIWAAMAFCQMGGHENRQKAWELTQIINPVNHGNTAEGIARYKVEPYVIAADVYGVAPHTGRGGWTWYSGSSGWMYRLIIESLLGVSLTGNQLTITPCLPPHWNGYSMDYRYRDTAYHIRVHMTRENEPGAVASLTLDGHVQANGIIILVDDRKQHTVEVTALP